MISSSSVSIGNVALKFHTNPRISYLRHLKKRLFFWIRKCILSLRKDRTAFKDVGLRFKKQDLK